MHDRGIGRQGLLQSIHPWQRFICDIDQLQRGLGLLLRFSNDQSHLVDDTAHQSPFSPAQHLLVRHDETILIDGDILRGQHRHHARRSLRARGIETHDTSGYLLRPQNFHVQLTGHMNIARVQSLTRHFLAGIKTGDG